MSEIIKKYEVGGSSSGNTGKATGFIGRRPRNSSRDTDDTDDTDLPPISEDTEPSPLESWIEEYDYQKAATCRRTPPIASAYGRLTYTPATVEVPAPASARSGSNASSNSWIRSVCQVPAYQLQDSHISSNFTPPTSSTPTFFTSTSTPTLSLPNPYMPPGYRRLPSSFARPQLSPQIRISSTLVEPVPTSSWDSKSLTRDWTPDQVLTAIKRIFSEIDLDWYAQNYMKLDFDGSKQVVWVLWEEIKLVYIQFISSHTTWLDIMTLMTMSKGSLESAKEMLANMICFFGAGKVGMEKRAENMARALISGGMKDTATKLMNYADTGTTGDIISFVELRCVENGLVYPGGTARTQERIALALTRPH